MAIGNVEQIDFTNAVIRSKMREGKTFEQAVKELQEEAQAAFDKRMDECYAELEAQPVIE